MTPFGSFTPTSLDGTPSSVRGVDAVNAGVSVGTTSTLVLSANPRRIYAAFVNDGTDIVYLALGNTAVVNRGIRLNPSGGSFEITRECPYWGQVSGIVGTTASNVTTVELEREEK